MTGALDGLLVVSLEQAVAAPLCTARLADAGARVIKIERPEGDFARDYDDVVHGDSAYFVWLNRGKESLVADLRQPDDQALVAAIVAQADVFVQNLAPGAAARLGFGADSLRARFPRLVVCSISGYGEAGPYRDMKAYDLLIQCETGLAAITGTPEAPGRVGVSAADIACGMNAYAAILEALIRRGKAGQGAAIAVSLFDGIAEWMTVPLLHADYGGVEPARVGISHASIAPYGLFSAGDGSEFVIAVQNEREWRHFCHDVLQRADMADDARFASNPSRCSNRPALAAAIAKALVQLDGATLAERLVGARIAFGRLNDVAGLSAHPQLRRIEVQAPGGAVSMPAPPAIIDGEPPRAFGRVPGLGADTARLRAEFTGSPVSPDPDHEAMT